MRFKVYGPYDIGVDEGPGGLIDKEDIQSFWKKFEVKPDEHKLPDACGVYIFGMGRVEGRKTGMGAKPLPWYVGKAARQTFKQECFTGKNKNTFNTTLDQYKKKGKPFLYLLARFDENDEFSEPATNKPYRDVGFVEEMFIQLSLSINKRLENKSATTMAKQTSIRGLLNTTQHRSDRVDDFKSAFGIKEDREPVQIVKYTDTKFRYGVYGPYEVPYKNQPKAIEQDHVKQMWDNICKQQKEMGEACGVYVIGIRHGNNTTPWYVGTAEKIGFEERCFEFPVERGIVENKGNPVIYFLPKLADKKGASGFAKPRQTLSTFGDMDYVTRVLLEYGVQVNEKILLEPAALHLKFLQSLSIEGFVKSKAGQPSKAVRELRSLLGK